MGKIWVDNTYRGFFYKKVKLIICIADLGRKQIKMYYSRKKASFVFEKAIFRIYAALTYFLREKI